MRRVALVLVAVAACSHAAVPRLPAEPDTPPIVEPLAPPITVTVANPATAYDEDLPNDTPSSEIPSGAATEPGPLHDRRLDAAAAELLEVVHQGAALSPELVQFVTHAHGIVEAPKFYLTQPPVEVLKPWNTRVGTAGELTLVIHVGPVRFTALPRGFKGSFELRATLALPYEDPRVTVTGDDGSVAHPAVTVEGTAFRASIICSGTTSLIKVEADVGGPLAVVPVTCGTPPNTLRVEPERNLQGTDVERTLTALINRERIAAQLPPLHTDRRVTLAAVWYAHVMKDANATAHDLAGTPLTRLADAGRRPRHVNEMTFRATNLAQASMRLLNEPTARAQVLANNATHLGVGVAKSAIGELFVAIDYIQILPPIDGAALEARVTRQILDRRNTRRLLQPFEIRSRSKLVIRRSGNTFAPGQPLVDGELQEHARQYASMLAAGSSSAAVHQTMKRKMPTSTLLFQLDPHRRFFRINAKVVEVIDPATVDESKLFVDGAVVEAIGIGVAQSARDSILSGRIYMVILYATPNDTEPLQGTQRQRLSR